jgi:hypothetical protein
MARICELASEYGRYGEHSPEADSQEPTGRELSEAGSPWKLGPYEQSRGRWKRPSWAPGTVTKSVTNYKPRHST